MYLKPNKQWFTYFYALDTKGYYAILGVSEQAKYYEIRAAYRSLAKKYHPDVNNSLSSEEMIKKINAAFEVLSDKEKRKQYDKIHVDDGNNTLHHHKANEKTNVNDNYAQPNESDKTNNNNPANNYYYRHAKSQSQRSPSITITDSLDLSKSRFHIIVEPSLCMAFGSCETLAPKVFVVEKDKMLNPKAKVVSETAEDFDAILAAAETCPTKAIIIIDRNTGEQIYP